MRLKEFKTQINELFDRPAKWQLTKDTRGAVEYKSNINDKDLVVVFHNARSLVFHDVAGTWEVIFAVDSEESVTGEGDEIVIFSTVLDIMKDFIQRRNPEKLFFAAEKSDGPSRIRLYTRLIRRFARDHGYQLVDKNDRGWEVAYTLVRIQGKSMKSFKQFKTQINELFDRPANWRIIFHTDYEIHYESNIQNRELIVKFWTDRNQGDWSVVFTVDEVTDVTDEGDEIIIFSTVLNIIENFIHNNDPESLEFAAEKNDTGSDSRVRLYNRLIKRFASSVGYELQDSNEDGKEVQYTLIKS